MVDILNSILANPLFNFFLFAILGTIVVYCFICYKKGQRVARFYGFGFFLLILARIIQVLRNSIKSGSLLDIIGLIAVAVCIILALVLIFRKHNK